MKIRVPVDPVDAVADELQQWFADLDGFDDVIVRTTRPANWQAVPAAPRLLLVENDGGPGMWPVATIVTLRVTAWTHGRDTDLCTTAIGLLLSGRPIAGLARVKPGTWPIEATDSTTHASLNSATVRATVRTEEKDI
ncbi:hypothetical protein [Gordonia sp. MMO-8]|uniref:hypothetical protein n=1 Tax=Gordonia sp. MMO-8 TaxID=3127886 RepID=UPI00301688B3